MNIFEIRIKKKERKIDLIPFKIIDDFGKMLKYKEGIDGFYTNTIDNSIFMNENCEFF